MATDAFFFLLFVLAMVAFVLVVLATGVGTSIKPKDEQQRARAGRRRVRRCPPRR